MSHGELDSFTVLYFSHVLYAFLFSNETHYPLSVSLLAWASLSLNSCIHAGEIQPPNLIFWVCYFDFEKFNFVLFPPDVLLTCILEVQS